MLKAEHILFFKSFFPEVQIVTFTSIFYHFKRKKRGGKEKKGREGQKEPIRGGGL